MSVKTRFIEAARSFSQPKTKNSLLAYRKHSLPDEQCHHVLSLKTVRQLTPPLLHICGIPSILPTPHTKGQHVLLFADASHHQISTESVWTAMSCPADPHKVWTRCPPGRAVVWDQLIAASDSSLGLVVKLTLRPNNLR